MKVKSIPSGWIYEEGLRLDCGPYMSGAIEAKKILENLEIPKEPLQKVTQNGIAGIYHAGRIKRLWVECPDYGYPFLSSTDILQADLSGLRYISKISVKENPQLLIQKDWTLITRSGSIGRMVFSRPDMDGMACTEDVLRVVPNKSKILPGYLYAYMSSRFGVPLVIYGTYGAIIQHIEPNHIADLPIPRFHSCLEEEIDLLVNQSSEKRVKASQLLRDSKDLLEKELNFCSPKDFHDIWTSQSSLSLGSRLDAFYFHNSNKYARSAFDRAGKLTCLHKVADVFIPNIFKRRYADDPSFGYPYITGSDVFELSPSSNRFLMKSVAKENRLLLEQGMILVHEAGQLSGLIGHSVQVGSYLDGFACTNNMVRVKPNDSDDRGYLFTLLSSEYGVRLIQREAAGSSIPHIEVSRIQNLEIPWPDKEIRCKIGEPAMKAQDLRDEACELENQARALVEKAIEEAA